MGGGSTSEIEDAALNEKTLEDVTGGVFKEPKFAFTKQCPCCGAGIILNGDEERVMCSCCGRTFRVAPGTLIEENQG